MRSCLSKKNITENISDSQPNAPAFSFSFPIRLQAEWFLADSPKFLSTTDISSHILSIGMCAYSLLGVRLFLQPAVSCEKNLRKLNVLALFSISANWLFLNSYFWMEQRSFSDSWPQFTWFLFLWLGQDPFFKASETTFRNVKASSNHIGIFFELPLFSVLLSYFPPSTSAVLYHPPLKT